MNLQRAILGLLAGVVSGVSGAPDSWEQGFERVPDADKPWAYWWWLNGHVDEGTVTRDLEAMRAQGIGGVLLFDARGYHDDASHVLMPRGGMDFMGPAWRRMVRFALSEASRLNLQVSLNLSSCAGALKGPWPVGDDAPKRLQWRATAVRGPARFRAGRSRPPGARSWRVAVMAVRHGAGAATALPAGVWHEAATAAGSEAPVAEVVEVPDPTDAEGHWVWEAPPGQWTLLEFGYATMAGHEYDVDVLDHRAVAGHFERMGRRLLAEAGPLAGKTLTHFYSVSWEGAVPTWTPGLEQEFMKYRGYALRSWLPVLAGCTVASRDQSERFLRDYYRTLGDVFRENFYGTMRALCHEAGLQWHSESGGPWNRRLASFREADQLAFLGRNDMPQGEFWFAGDPPRHRQAMNRPPAMAAHIYGRPLAAAEAFTHMRQHWSAYPAVLKPYADAAFCDGVNHLIWHTFTCSPPRFGQPGNEYFAGTHLNPNVTWFAQAGAFLDYLGRCQFLLRQGQPVSDVCAYIGDAPYHHWGRGTSWSARATLDLPRGYTYDLLNTEVLLDRLKADHGGLVLPEGHRYRLLVVDLDEPAIRPDALQKIAELKQAGATVVFGRRLPQSVPGLARHPGADAEVRRRAAALWTRAPSLAGVLGAMGLPADCEGPGDYTHRRTADADLYFIAGHGPADYTFRVRDRQPELWDPVWGTRRDAAVWRRSADNRTTVALDLPGNGSAFVVFRRPAGPPLASPPADLHTSSGAATTLTGPWTVRFEAGRGAPASAVFETLRPWNDHPDAGIRYFSGRATYRQVFTLGPGEARRAARLELGEVRCLARVRLNGRDLGVVWTAPWGVPLGGAARAGSNELEIDVVNTWVNRLIGDAGLPQEQRLTRSNVALESGPRTLKAHQGFASGDPLMRSGLMGPVRLRPGP